MTDNFSDMSKRVAETESSAEMSASASAMVSDDFKPWQNFSIAFLAGALLSFVGLSISMEMTSTPLGDVSGVQWLGAIALPFLLGTLAVTFKQPFLDALDAMMRLLPY